MAAEVLREAGTGNIEGHLVDKLLPHAGGTRQRPVRRVSLEEEKG